MFAEAKPVFWPEEFEEPKSPRTLMPGKRVTHLRHRVGEYDVTRLVLESNIQEESPEL